MNTMAHRQHAHCTNTRVTVLCRHLASSDPGASSSASSEGSVVFLNDFVADTSQRVWLETLPEMFRTDAMRPYTEAEITAAAAKCNTEAKPPLGRKPKLILQLGAAGSGKSSRLSECCHLMGGLSSAFGMTKEKLLQGMRIANSPELAEYTLQLEHFNGDTLIGFKDAEHWCYQGSGPHKRRFANEALGAKKDVVMGVTKTIEMTETYKSVIENAVKDGYEICGIGCFIEPTVLVQRQLARATESGRLAKMDKTVTDGNLVRSAFLEQRKAVDALHILSKLVKEGQGTLLIFDNSHDSIKSPAGKKTAFWVQRVRDVEITYAGDATLEGLVKFVETINKHL